MQGKLIQSLCAVVLLACTTAAQAVAPAASGLSYVDHLGFGGYSGSINGDFFSDAAIDLSANGDVALLGSNLYSSPVTGATLEHGYAADAYLINGQLSLSLTQYAYANVANATTLSHQQDVLSSLSLATLRITGTGQAQGTPVHVSFSGLATSIYSVAPGIAGYLNMDLAIMSGGNVLGSFLWDASGANGQQNINFGFDANVGDEIVISATLASGTRFDDLALAARAEAYQFDSISAQMQGSFSVTPVPEPENYALFLAGLGLIGTVLRRKQ